MNTRTLKHSNTFPPKSVIKKGELFSEENLAVKRPWTGISPMEWDNILGKSSNVNYKVDDLIKL
jgi:N,N'-diacetyllegionaminate synthase